MVTPSTPPTALAAIPSTVVRWVLAQAFLAAGYAALRPSVDLASGWLPDVGGLRPVLGVVLAGMGAALLVGWRVRAVALGAALVVLVLLGVHLAHDRLYDTATHLLPWAGCAVALLVWREPGLLMLDRRQDPPRPEHATFVLRLFLGSIFVVQGWHDLIVVGPVAFARAAYVAPLADSWVPAPLLWLAGVTNPPVQLVTGLALLVGFRTRVTAAIVAGFLVTILFGHLLGDPLDRGPDTHDYGLANLALALALLRIGGHGEAFALSRPRLGTAVALGLGLSTSACVRAPIEATGVACRADAGALLTQARALAATDTLDDAWQALDVYARAEALDPACAAAPAEAAELLVESRIGYSGPGHHLTTSEIAERATRLAQRALRRAPNDARAHHVLGNIALYNDYDWCRARQELDAALASDPSRVYTRILRAYLSVIAGRTAEAEAALDLLASRPTAHATAEVAHAVVEYMTDRSPAAIARLGRLRVDAPAIASFWRGLARVQTGDAVPAVHDLEAFAEASHRNPGGIAGLGQAYAAAGRPDDARAVLFELLARAPTEGIVGYQDAGLVLALGDRDAALAVLEPAVRIERDNWPTWLALDPRFRALHGTPRFDALLRWLDFARARTCFE